MGERVAALVEWAWPTGPDSIGGRCSPYWKPTTVTLMTTTLPESCSIAFKEWAGVCDALGSGRQSLILRKGGISEGSGGFRPEHSAFWLYPTFVHEAEQGLRTHSGRGPVETPGSVAIDSLAVVEWFARVERVDQLAELSDLHDWAESTVLTRFHYRTPGLWALAVRVYCRAEPWPVAITPAHLGCKTWVPLETPLPTSRLAAVLDDEASGRRLDMIRSRFEERMRNRQDRGRPGVEPSPSGR